MKKLLLICFVAFFYGNLQAQDEKMLEFAETIKAEDLKKHLSILASDEYEGRETGEKGAKMAAEYIKKHFESLGLAGPVKSNSANPYFQPFDLERVSMSDFTIITQAQETLKVFEDFYPYGKFLVDETSEVVFAGYGIDTDYYSDYESIDVSGKTAIILMGTPQNAENEDVLKEEDKRLAMSTTKIKLAREKGATHVIMVYGSKAEFEQRNRLFKRYYSKPSLGLPKDDSKPKTGGIVFTTDSIAQKILGVSASRWNKAIEKGKKKPSKLTKMIKPSQAKLKSEVTKEKVRTENVLGFLEGTDKKDEILVLTAHYDHVGIIDGKIHNGADDDGSGTSAVLEMAEAFAKAARAGHRPRRSILFMTVTGEEKGLLGSEYYSENPIFPLENTVVNLNTDMIGRVDPKHEAKDVSEYIYIIGSDMLSSDLHNLHEEVAKRHFPKMELDYQYNNDSDPNRYYYRSDHYNFAKNNIPVIFYFNGTHADYHKHTDTVEKINFEKMNEITRMIFSTAWVIANREARIEVDKAK